MLSGYGEDDDAIFLLGDRNVPDGPDPPDFPLLVEYSRDGRVLRNMIPASTLKDRGDSFKQNGEIGQPALRVTKNHIETGEAVPVRKALSNHNDAPLWFVGLKEGQYLYLADRKNLYIQSSAAQEPVPLDTKQID